MIINNPTQLKTIGAYAKGHLLEGKGDQGGPEPNPRGEQESTFDVERSTQLTAYDKFEDMNLPMDLLRSIFGKGFVKPSVIQSKGIYPMSQGKDVIAQAQSGSGKTATFGIGVLAQLDLESNSNLEKSGSGNTTAMPQALILAPTRELADQIHNVIKDLSAQMNIKIHLSIGGSRVSGDKIHAHVVVGTPGRVKDMIQRGKLDTSFLKSIVLDEADDLLGYGFIEQINDILKQVPSDSQIGIFSATMEKEVVDLCQKIMKDPVKILVKNENLTLAGIRQFYISCSNDDIKYENLKQIFMNMEITQCIIYANRREMVEFISEKLTQDGFVITCIHGGLHQDVRNASMKDFRSASTRILVSSDLLARGIDVNPVGLVVNFELPKHHREYIHRVGRSGRFGRRGIAINLISKMEAKKLLDIEQYYTTQIEKLPDDLESLG